MMRSVTHPSAVPHFAQQAHRLVYHHTLAQYRTSHRAGGIAAPEVPRGDSLWSCTWSEAEWIKPTSPGSSIA
eukprot:3403934-Rhodomonas_salina.4